MPARKPERLSLPLQGKVFRDPTIFAAPKSSRVNKLIKIFTKRSKKSKENVLIVVDAIRNPFEAIFFRERYSAFYLMAINTPENDRVRRLAKMSILNDEQIKNISDKEYE